MKKSIALVVVVGLALIVWMLRSEQAPERAETARSERIQQTTPMLPVASVLDVRPGVTHAPSAPIAAPSTRMRPPESQNLRQFRERKDYASLYQRIASDNSPEALYLKSEIFVTCAFDAGKSAKERADESAQKRAKFVASMSGATNDVTKRIEAYDRMMADPCAGLDIGTYNAKEYERMVAIAAAAGDFRAQALQWAERVEKTYYRTSGGTPYRMGAEDFEQGRRLLQTGDPEVIRDIRGALSSTLEGGQVRIDGQPIDHRAMFAALEPLGCDMGSSCGPDNSRILMSCAYQGQCSSNSLSEHAFYYELSPSQSQFVEQYRRTLLAMVSSGNMSNLTFSTDGTPDGFSMSFRTRPRRPGGSAAPAKTAAS